jgi:tetratricopeptide (TPR) repeat protein
MMQKKYYLPILPIITAAIISINQKVAIGIHLFEFKQSGGLVAVINSEFGRDRTSLIAQNNSQVVKAQKYSKLALQKVLTRDFKGALADLDRAIQIDPNYAKAYNSRGTVKMLGFKDYQGAALDINRALQIDPKLSAAYTNRGTLKAMESQDYQGALVEFNRAIQINPNDIDAYTNRAATKYRFLKDRAGGIADLQKAVKLLQQAGKQEQAQSASRFLKQWQLETKRTGTL